MGSVIVTIRVGNPLKPAEAAPCEARVAVNGDAVTARVVFGEPGDATRLGRAVLEELGLAVDPVGRRLVPAKFLLY